MRRLLSLALPIFALSLAACGGGGSSGGGITPQPPIESSPPQAMLKAGFAGGGAQTAAIVRRGASALIRRPMTDPVLNGAVEPIAIFAVPDGYIQTQLGGTLATDAVAFLDTSNGSILPSPLPNVSWSQSGNPVQTSMQNITPTPAPSGQNTTVIGALNLSAPPETGVSTFTASAMGQTVSFDAYTYLDLGISSNPNSPYGVQYLLFDAQGVAAVTDAAHAELEVTTGSTQTTITVPGGSIEAVPKWLDAVTAADWNAAAAQPSMSGSTVCDGKPNTFLLLLSDGRLAKWTINAMNAGSASLMSQCLWTDAQGTYMVAQNGAFAY